MCGIVGIIDFKEKYNSIETFQHLKNMSKEQEHRGPDNFNFWIDKKNKVSFGFQRLAIQDLSSNGNQPMESNCKRYIIIFNGEIYNFQDLKLTLQSKGVIFKSCSDTEVLLSAISEWGLVDTIEKICGMYAFSIWDKKLKLLHLIRDRVGEKPLYYGWQNNFFVFASELKAIKKHPSFIGEINNKAVSLQLKFGNVPAPLSIYKNIYKLEPASILTLKVSSLEDAKNSLKIKKYWIPKVQNLNKNIDSNFVLCQTQKKFIDAIKRQCISDVPIGTFLSGGVDSSLITALIKKNHNKKIKTFSIGFNHQTFNEAKHSKEIAKFLDTDHHELYINSKDALKTVPSLSEIYDEPFSDASQIPTIILSKFAKQKITVALTGDGGDELFGGYNRHIYGPNIFKKYSKTPDHLKKILRYFVDNIPQSFLNSISSISNIPDLKEKIYKILNAIEAKNFLEFYFKLLSGENEKTDSVGLTHLRSQLVFNKKISLNEQLMLWDLLYYLPNSVLVKVDRAAMANSLETRSPFLDHNVIEHSLNLPSNFKVKGKISKWVLKRILYNHIPRKYFERPKSGFTIPIRAWLEGSLNEWSNDLLDISKIKKQGYLDDYHINLIKLFKAKNVKIDYYKLWNILTFQSWLNQ